MSISREEAPDQAREPNMFSTFFVESLQPVQHTSTNQKRAPPKTRAAVRHSCEPCRKKKIKCDRNVECNQCKRAKVECLWAETATVNVPRFDSQGNLIASKAVSSSTLDQTPKLAPASGSAAYTAACATWVGRKRIRLSCEPCREKKRKCDKQAVCGHCRKMNTPCVWAENSLRSFSTSQDTPEALWVSSGNDATVGNEQKPKPTHRDSSASTTSISSTRSFSGSHPSTSPPTTVGHQSARSSQAGSLSESTSAVCDHCFRLGNTTCLGGKPCQSCRSSQVPCIWSGHLRYGTSQPFVSLYFAPTQYPDLSRHQFESSDVGAKPRISSPDSISGSRSRSSSGDSLSPAFEDVKLSPEHPLESPPSETPKPLPLPELSMGDYQKKRVNLNGEPRTMKRRMTAEDRLQAEAEVREWLMNGGNA